MNALAMAACLCALGLIGLLPRIFFRRGRFNARWFLTASPFGVSGATLVLALLGRVTPLFDAAFIDVVAMALAAVGVALIRWTLATHARPVSLWHQENDRPDELVTRGAYARVRHPFYASFLLVLLACALAMPHACTIGALAAAFLLLDRTAAREERRLTREFGARYSGYVARTGRFVPRALIVVVLVAAGSTGAEAQIGEPLRGAKVAAVVEPVEPQSLGRDVLVGASMGLMAGGLVGMALCAWDELTTVGVLRDDEEDEYQCDVESPLLAILTGTMAGALVGGVVGLFGGDMPRGDFFEWSTDGPGVDPDDPKRSKIDDAAFMEQVER